MQPQHPGQHQQGFAAGQPQQEQQQPPFPSTQPQATTTTTTQQQQQQQQQQYNNMTSPQQPFQQPQPQMQQQSLGVSPQMQGQPQQYQQQRQQQPGTMTNPPPMAAAAAAAAAASLDGNGGAERDGEEEETSASMLLQSPAALGNRIKGMFSADHTQSQGPNFGFTPTAAMAQRHEDALVSSKRPLFQFQVTKLRNWRTGYVRLLCLYDDHVSTVDPDSHQPTNTWRYSALADYSAVPDKPDQVVMQFDKKDKLKFQCHNVDKSRVLTALLECQGNDAHYNNSTGGKSSVAAPPRNLNLVLCSRWNRHGLQTPSALRLTPYALLEIHPASRQRLQTYRFVDIVAISFSTDDPNGLILHFSSKTTTRLFTLTGSGNMGAVRSEIVTAMRQAYQRLGLELRMTESTTTMQWKQARHEQLQSHRRQVTIATEYAVTKQSRRHDSNIVGASAGWPGGIVSRTLCLTGQGWILEKDPSDGSVVSCRPLKDLYAIVRPAAAGDQVLLEFAGGGQTRAYASASRDSLIVSLFDAASTLGRNPKVHISDVPSAGYNLASFAKSAAAASTSSSSSSSSSSTTPEKKSGGLFQPISIPVHCLKRVHAVATAAFSYLNSTTESSTEEGQPANPIEECRNVVELCREFNASVLPTAEGLPTGDKDKYVLGSIGALWGLVAELLECRSKDRHLAEQSAAPMFQTLHRLSKTPSGYKHSIELATFIDTLPLLWTIDDAFCKFWAFRTLTVVLSGLTAATLSPRRDRDKEVEYVNKSVIFKAGGPRLIHGLVNALLNEKASDLIRMVMSDILQSVLCSFADTTGPEPFGALIQALGENYQALLSTLYQQTPFVIENSALLLHLLSTHAPSVAASIREAALSSAILLHHFHAAIFSPLEGQRFLSRFLCSLWLAGPMDCDEKKWLRRTVPRGFMGYLKMPVLSRVEEEQLDALERDAVEENIPEDPNDATAAAAASYSGAAGTNTSRLRSRIALARAIAAKDQTNQALSLPENFRIFFHVLTQNHSLPDLIWNQQTRRELRIGLESEIQYIQRETEARGINQIAWNHQQFGIEYPSLENELRVGSVYMRLWLQAGEGFIKSWDEPLRLFELLFRRFLCEMDRNIKVTVMCIRCLERLYAIHGNTIGAFPDVMILIRSMASTRSIETQHRLLGLLATILGVQKDENGDESTINVQENAEQLLNTESIEQLCQFVAWGHTNGVQVGNLMTTVLGTEYAHSGRAMLTDGSEMTPEGDPAASSSNHPTSTTEAAADASCPPVWFIASTGRIPPPPETVRGPFRVSQLLQMMENGDLSPFTLVTSTRVDSYEDDEDSTGDSTSDEVKEAQIDTGKWKRLDQVWQLRWQLCTDGNSTGLFTPSEVALRAIRSLTRLVDLHKSLDYRGLPYYPIPIAKRIMCGLSRDPFTSGNGQVSTEQNESFLSILAQSVLCNDPQVVNQAAELLLKLMRYNEEAMSKFYLTGIYFFTASYTGSNFKTLAELLHSTHLKQHFRSGFAAAADTTELPLKERSILGGLLPEGVLFILLNYGIERFSEVFVGNFDTPEVIWNFEMRKHLIEMVRQHLGDFPKRLWQNTTTKYEYCPMPGVAYKRLEKEIFCHNYYLHNLCDEGRFTDWPIAEPVEVFRACLEEFKKQMSRDETEEVEAVEGATKILKLKAGDGSKELRKAYRSMARIYHPDKNPGGREMFEAIQAAYELLLPLVESGQKIQGLSGSHERDFSGEDDTEGDSVVGEGFAGGLLQMKAIQLLIRTQALICRRFEKEMAKYKYPAYQMLFACLKLPSSSVDARNQNDTSALLRSALMTPRRAEFVRDTVELVFRTCLVSPLNAEELVNTSGVLVLDELLDFYVNCAHLLDTAPKSKQRGLADETVSQILANIIHTLSGVAFYESGRAAIAALESRSRFCINWRRCLDGRYLGERMKNAGDTLIKRYALEGVGHMAKDEALQAELISCGVVWPLLRFLLGFDPTLDEGGMSRDSLEDDIGISQAASNCQARLAVRGLGMLCGALQDKNLASPKNPLLQNALDALLTAPIALLLRNKRTSEILKILNANVETPSRIWNINMRAELVKFIVIVEQERPEDSVRPVLDELQQTSNFEYGALKNELRIGGIYIRLFNQAGLDSGSTREIQSPAVFAKQLLAFVAKCIDSSKDLPDGWLSLDIAAEELDIHGMSTTLQDLSISDRKFVLVLTALKILVRSDGLIDDVLCNLDVRATPVLLSLLELPQESEAFEIGCDILATLSPNQYFADAVAEQGALWRLLWVLERPDAQDQVGDESTPHGNQSEMLRKQRGWMLLESLSSSSSVAEKIVESTAWLELLGILVGYSGFTKVWIARTGSAKTLSRLLWDPKTGQNVAPLLQRFLPSTLIVVLKEEGADKMLNLFDGESDTPELIWESSMRTDLRRVVGQLLDSCIEERRQVGSGNEAYVLDPNIRVKYQRLDDELFIGGVYVSRFLKEPTYNIRDPTRFLEMLLQRWAHELQSCTKNDRRIAESQSTALTAAGSDTLQSVTNASVYICKIRSNLCDKLSHWGYMGRCLTFLDEVLRKELYGTPLLSIMRIIHVSVNCRSNVENLILSGKNDRTDGIVPLTMRAIEAEELHKDVAFMLEMTKKLFTDALGDLKSVHDGTGGMQRGVYAMAPSPAPGEGPVSRNRVSRGNPMDDPLAMPPSFDPPTAATNGGQIQNAMQSPSMSTASQSMALFPPQPQMSSSYGQGYSNQSNSMAYPQQSFSNPQGNMYGLQGTQAQPSGHQYNNTTQGQYQNQGHAGRMQRSHSQTPSYQQPPQSSSSYQSRSAQSQSMNHPLGYSPTVSGRTSVANSNESQAWQQQPSTYGRPFGHGAPAHSTNQQQFHQAGMASTTTSSMQQQQRQQRMFEQQQPQQHQQQLQQQQGTFQQQQLQQQQGTFQPQQQPQQQGMFQQQQQPQKPLNNNQYAPVGSSMPRVSQEQARPFYEQQQIQTQNLSVPQQPTFQQGTSPTLALSGSGNAMNQNLQSQNQPHRFNSSGMAPGSVPQQPPQQSIQSSTADNSQGGTVPVPQGFSSLNEQPGSAQSAQRTEGTGVDARATLSPKEEAERRMKTVAGARGSADGRVALLQSAIICDFPNFIVDSVLENPKLPQVKDAAAAKVHGVELLKLLSQDPGYGMKFQQILDGNPKWKKYKTQDHSLFITGPEQRADYFLTDGGNGEAKKLLTQG